MTDKTPPTRQVELTLHDVDLNQHRETPTTFTVDSFKVTDNPDLRAGVHEMAKIGDRLWKDFASEQRQALVSLISEALTEMAGNVEDWLEDAMVARSGSSVGIFVMFKLGSIDDQVLLLRDRAQAERDARVADLERLSALTTGN